MLLNNNKKKKHENNADGFWHYCDRYIYSFTLFDCVSSLDSRIVCAMVYYGITLNTHRLGGESDHLNLLLVALSSLPNSIIAAVVCKKFGGKWPQIIFIVGSGVVLLVSTGIPEGKYK